MNEQVRIRRQIENVLGELKYLNRLLYIVQDAPTRNLALQQMQTQMNYLAFLVSLLGHRGVPSWVDTEGEPRQRPIRGLPPPAPVREPYPPAGVPEPAGMGQPGPIAPALPPPSLPGREPRTSQNTNASPDRTFTRAELATFTGRNGKPAYVAVNGTVYDVTNNAAWSLATHFGLQAGRDLTTEFAQCHGAQQWILKTLTPVGRLV